MVYSNPIFDERTILSHYRQCAVDKCIDPEETPSIRVNMRRYLDRLTRVSGVGKGRLLDVGCGAGHLLEYARARGFEVNGVDPSIGAVKYACSVLGSEVVVVGAYTSELYRPEAFDLITMIHVIDHVVSPKDLLETARYHLKAGGYLFVATHDTDSLLARLTGEDFIAYSVQHISYFIPKTLRAMMKQCGLWPVKTLRSLTTYSLRHYAENGIRNPTLRERIIRWLSALHLDALRLSFPFGNMEVIARKDST